ncbi:MAG: D-alanyl-D-alanine carboxypeptidase [Prevotella sp.]|nr:D-alanyl-D-alanine carboxypeptidase [Prevotella sp.]
MRIRLYLLVLMLATGLHSWAQDATGGNAGGGYSPSDDAYSAWINGTRGRLGQMLGAPLLAKTQVGMMVYDLNAGQVVFAHNERQRMWPGAVLQVVTAVTALDLLGVDYGFHTSLCHRGRVEGDTLRGDLYFVGGFDPTLTRDDLKAFADTIRRFGIRHVEGMLVADLSMKDTLSRGEGWCWDIDYERLIPLQVDRKDEFMRVMMQEMRAAGISLDVTLAKGKLPQGCTEIYRHRTGMEKVLRQMLKKSDNLYAEAMFYQIAKANTTKAARASDASKAEKRLVARLGFDDSIYTFADGSGISLYSYVTAELLVGMLKHGCYNRDFFTRIYPSMPVSGMDGTLASRMTTSPCRGKVHAMTGVAPGLSTIAGYCQASTGHTLCFVILNQGLTVPTDAIAFQDKVCEVLCR